MISFTILTFNCTPRPQKKLSWPDPNIFYIGVYTFVNLKTAFFLGFDIDFSGTKKFSIFTNDIFKVSLNL